MCLERPNGPKATPGPHCRFSFLTRRPRLPPNLVLLSGHPHSPVLQLDLQNTHSKNREVPIQSPPLVPWMSKSPLSRCLMQMS